MQLTRDEILRRLAAGQITVEQAKELLDRNRPTLRHVMVAFTCFCIAAGLIGFVLSLPKSTPDFEDVRNLRIIFVAPLFLATVGYGVGTFVGRSRVLAWICFTLRVSFPWLYILTQSYIFYPFL